MDICYKEWQHLTEGDVIRIATEIGWRRYAVDVDATLSDANPHNAEVWLTEIDDHENPIGESEMWDHVASTCRATVEACKPS